MKRACILILGLAQTAYADDPFACVDPDVVDAFLGDPFRGRGTYSTNLPDEYADLKLPPGLSLVASQRMDSGTTVVYKTNGVREEALDAAVEAMAAIGWAEKEPQNRRGTGGFQTSAQRFSATMLCHDDSAGALHITATDKADRTFLYYGLQPVSPTCGDEDPPHVGHDTSEIMSLLPTLRLPEEVTATSNGMGGNGHQVSSRVDVSGPLSRSDLSTFLEDQIRDQQWEFQTRWSSLNSSGSVWALETVDSGLLVGTLHLMDAGADPIRIRFSVTPADPTKGKSRGTWSRVSR